MNKILSQLSAKKQELDSRQPLSRGQIANLDKWFKVELTYTSNAIEGNTLSRAETALVVEKGIAIEGKTLQEHLEAVNHAEAWNFIKSLIAKKRQDLTQTDILNIHRLVLSKIDDANAGRYRTMSVRIAGSTVIMPSPLKVPDLMNDFVLWLKAEESIHPAYTAALAHYKLVSIHPFADGNGRTARLLMNMLLMQTGYPPAIIRKEERGTYINALEKAQLGGNMDNFLTLIYKSIERSLDIYLDLDKNQKDQLFKIGKLAKLTLETVHTIRFWTKEGLLHITNYTPGGYQLYNSSMIDQVKQIRKLQKESRLTLNEIKKRLGH